MLINLLWLIIALEYFNVIVIGVNFAGYCTIHLR